MRLLVAFRGGSFVAVFLCGLLLSVTIQCNVLGKDALPCWMDAGSWISLASQEIRAGHLGPRCTAGLILGKRMRQIVQLGALLH